MRDYSEAWDREYGRCCPMCKQRIPGARVIEMWTDQVVDITTPPPLSQESIALLFQRIREDMKLKPPGEGTIV